MPFQFDSSRKRPFIPAGPRGLLWAAGNGCRFRCADGFVDCKKSPIIAAGLNQARLDNDGCFVLLFARNRQSLQYLYLSVFTCRPRREGPGAKEREGIHWIPPNSRADERPPSSIVRWGTSSSSDGYPSKTCESRAVAAFTSNHRPSREHLHHMLPARWKVVSSTGQVSSGLAA